MDLRLSARLLTIGWVAACALCVSASTLSAAHGRPPQVFLPIGVSAAIYVTSGWLMLTVALTGHLPEGLTLSPLGYHTPKGIPEPQLLYRVATSGPG